MCLFRGMRLLWTLDDLYVCWKATDLVSALDLSESSRWVARPSTRGASRGLLKRRAELSAGAIENSTRVLRESVTGLRETLESVCTHIVACAGKPTRVDL